MRIVVDSNILFTFFWKNSIFRRLATYQLNLIAPEKALEEINNYKDYIKNKANITESEFQELKKDLALRVEFIALNYYKEYFNKVKTLSKEIPQEKQTEFLDDADFIALALKNDCPLWTHDKLLKKQSKIQIFWTKEIINLLDTE